MSALFAVLAILSQPALFSVPSGTDLLESSETIVVYRGPDDDICFGTDFQGFTVLDSRGTCPADYFIIHPEELREEVSISDYGETVYRDPFAVITRPEPGSSPEQCAGARPLREIRIAAPDDLIPRVAGYDDSVADIVAHISEDSILSIVGRLELFENRFYSSDSFPAARDWAVNWLVREGCPVEIQDFPVFDDTSQSIIMTFPGTVHPERIYLFGAHLDCGHENISYFPGADDNGSGSAAVMEAARAMVGYNFDSTVILCLWGAEEAGLVGSSYFAEQAWLNQDSIIAALNLDMVFYGPQIGPNDYAILNLNYNEQSLALAEFFASATASYVPELETHLYFTTFGGSDHVSFWEHGFTAVGGDEYLFSPWYHNEFDLLENYLEFFPYGTEVAKATAATLAALAVPNGPSGVEEGSSGSSLTLSVSPSPAQATASVFISGANDGARLSVYDTAGRRIIREETDSGSVVLNVSEMPPGMYLIRAVCGERTAVTRLVVIH